MDFSPADLFRSTKTGSRSSLDRVNKQLSASRGTFRQKVHIGVLVATVALVAYGAIIIWSASQFKADASFSRHLLGIGIGTVLADRPARYFQFLDGAARHRPDRDPLAQDSGSVLYRRSGHDGLDQDSRYRLDIPAG